MRNYKIEFVINKKYFAFKVYFWAKTKIKHWAKTKIKHLTYYGKNANMLSVVYCIGKIKLFLFNKNIAYII